MVSEPLTDVMTIHGRGSCPKCHESLWVADAEIAIMKLQPNGMPDPDSENITNRVSAYCPNCGHKQIMMRWKGGYIPYNYTLLMQLLIEEDEKRVNRIRALNGKDRDLDFNPLCE